MGEVFLENERTSDVDGVGRYLRYFFDDGLLVKQKFVAVEH